MFDSHFDAYRGVIALVRVFDGKITSKDTMKMLATKDSYDVVDLGVNHPKEEIKN